MVKQIKVETPSDVRSPPKIELKKIAVASSHHETVRNWTCENCKAQTAPTKRKGPHGTQTLCNACGIYWRRYSKNRPPEYFANKKHSDTSEDDLPDLFKILVRAALEALREERRGDSLISPHLVS
eukprot:TRINITY_DN9278_c0_g1_i1.p1 TRINITY_DN9278_c0_g1~~TRINITY_DN9278_c0_g1_i1.p1  ORF type:complete len:125 (-),score=22.29 TRINITY_DN9278_c0_g1_i1:264-638(-)